MKQLRIIIPALATVILTAGFVLIAMWLTGLVPDGDWSELIRAGIVILTVLGTLFAIAWSAYFTYVIRKSLQG